MTTTGAAVIGLGPAGAVTARVLADAGIPVTAFQAEGSAHGRAPLVSPAPTVRRHADEPARLASGPPQGADGIGGSKVLAAPQSYRLDDDTFRMRSRAVARYGRASIPADVDLADWPLTSDDLQRHYELVEHAMEVRPRPRSEWTARMTRAAGDLGHAPFDAPAAASRDVSPLVMHPGIRIVPATVLQIRTDSAGAVAGLDHVGADGEVRRLSCPAVVVAGSVIPTVRLLLLSGLSDDGRVGSCFMTHDGFVVHGAFPGHDLRRDRGDAATAVAISEFEGDRFDHTGLGFLGGSVLQAAMTGPRTRLWRASLEASLDDDDRDRARRWVRAHEASIGTVWAQPDQLPRASHRVDLDPEHRDPMGRPVARVTHDIAPDDRRRWSHLADRMAEWLLAAGAARTWSGPFETQPLGTHLYGGARMGDDPRTSVVDGHGRFHTVPGLVVVGSATFPSTGGRGPVQTIEALAWRSAERLAADLR